MTYQTDQHDYLVSERERVFNMREQEQRDWARSALKGRLEQLDQEIRAAKKELDR